MIKYNWQSITQKPLDEDFIREHSSEIMDASWHNIEKYSVLSLEFIEEFVDRFVWKYLCIYQELDEDFMRKYANRVNWFTACANQKMSESFIEEFSDKVHWVNISLYQDISDEFVEKYSEINKELLRFNKYRKLKRR